MKQAEPEIVEEYLRIIVALMLDQNGTQREHIVRLADLGLEPALIARILGKDAQAVSKELYKLRKRGRV
jgi:hypothetical protein